MSEKMPYLKEDEIIINAKTATTATSNSSASDVDDAEESLFENKVGATVNERTMAKKTTHGRNKEKNKPKKKEK